MFGLPAWLLVFPVLGFLILVHELGHFVTAKLFGIKVKEFGFGFPPRAFGFRYGETIYSINWIPLGGFVRMLGEDDPDEQDEDMSPGDRSRTFASQSVLKRIIVLSAGSFMNLLTPIVIFTVIFMTPQDTVIGDARIGAVAPGSPAEAAGLRGGDVIVKVGGKTIDNHVDLQQEILLRLGAKTEFEVKKAVAITGRGASAGFGSSGDFSGIETVEIVPRVNPPKLKVVETVTNPEKEVSLSEARSYDDTLGLSNKLVQGSTTLTVVGNNIEDIDTQKEISLVDARRVDPTVGLENELTQGSIGVTIATVNQDTVKRSHAIWNAIPMAFGEVRDVILLTKNGLERWIAGGDNPGLTGPIGIARVTGVVAEAGISPIFQLMAVLSISLGVINILPIPALDGGRLMFVIIEWVRRGKRLSPQREGLVHLVGFAVLISLIALVSFFDIVNLLNGDSVIR